MVEVDNFSNDTSSTSSVQVSKQVEEGHLQVNNEKVKKVVDFNLEEIYQGKKGDWMEAEEGLT